MCTMRPAYSLIRASCLTTRMRRRASRIFSLTKPMIILPVSAVQRSRGLVEDQDLGLGDDGARDGDPLLLAAGELDGQDGAAPGRARPVASAVIGTLRRPGRRRARRRPSRTWRAARGASGFPECGEASPAAGRGWAALGAGHAGDGVTQPRPAGRAHGCESSMRPPSPAHERPLAGAARRARRGSMAVFARLAIPQARADVGSQNRRVPT
jgi:hypothetical protein